MFPIFWSDIAVSDWTAIEILSSETFPTNERKPEERKRDIFYAVNLKEPQSSTCPIIILKFSLLPNWNLKTWPNSLRVNYFANLYLNFSWSSMCTITSLTISSRILYLILVPEVEKGARIVSRNGNCTSKNFSLVSSISFTYSFHFFWCCNLWWVTE